MSEALFCAREEPVYKNLLTKEDLKELRKQYAKNVERCKKEAERPNVKGFWGWVALGIIFLVACYFLAGCSELMPYQGETEVYKSDAPCECVLHYGATDGTFVGCGRVVQIETTRGSEYGSEAYGARAFVNNGYVRIVGNTRIVLWVNTSC